MAFLDENAIRVCVRPRPLNAKETAQLTPYEQQPIQLADGNFAIPRKQAPTGSVREIVEVIDNRQLDFDKPPYGAGGKRVGVGARRYKDKRYVFDRVFRKEASQQDVYENTAKPVLDGILRGYNSTVFAYGATGCGKTHTISGTAEDPGIIVRTMSDLFELIESSKEQFQTTIELSFVEIYNETIRDLLTDVYPAHTPPGGLKLLENEKERVRIAGVTTRQPTSVAEVMDLVLMGNERRSTSFTESNSVSSRSHAVLQVTITRCSRNPDVDMDSEMVMQDTSCATLSIIDLAGSERASATRNMGERMKEGANINKSLLALSSCISALCDASRTGGRPHIPYRNSKLTRLLKFSLGGNCRTVMIVCVSPSSKDIEDTNNTLLWASKAKSVKTNVSRVTGGTHVSVRQYLQTIAELTGRVKDLEEKLSKAGAGTENQLAKRKREEAQRLASESVTALLAQVQEMIPAIQEGAELRAKWDAASIGVSRLEHRRDEIDDDDDAVDGAREKEFCDQLITLQNDAYANNRSVQHKVLREQELVRSLEGLFLQTSDHPPAEAEELVRDHMRLQVDLQRAQLAANVAEAREKGYRTALSYTQDALARCAVAFERQSSLRRQNHAVLSSIISSGYADMESLQSLDETLSRSGLANDRELNNIFNSLSHGLTEVPPQPTTASLGGPLARDALRLTKVAPSPGSVKRIRDAVEGKRGGYEKKALRSPAAKARRTLREPKVRVARFADETGGELKQVFRFHPRSSHSPSTSFDLDTDSSDFSGDSWDEEVKDVVKPLAGPGPSSLRNTMLPEPTSSFRNTSQPSSSALFAGPVPAQAPVPAPAVVSAPAQVATEAPTDIPEWKKNRMLLGKGAASNANAIANLSNSPGQAGHSDSESPKMPAGPRTGALGLGRAYRPSIGPTPLGELRQIPNTSSRQSIPGPSNLLKPTAASARRESLSMRHERPKLHKSPPSYKTKPLGPVGPGGANGPAGTGASGARPRGSASLMAPLGAAGDASMPVLRTRASMQRLNGGGGGGGQGQGDGNTSMPPWK